MKTIVTHLAPDLDAIVSVWLVKNFFPGWKNAQIKFIPAGKAYENQPVDSNPEIIHVDTGLGKFDHHQFSERTSAVKIIFKDIEQNSFVDNFKLEVLRPIVKFCDDIDNFQEVFYPNAADDFYDFSLHQIVDGIRYTEKNDQVIVEKVSAILDAIFNVFSSKIKAKADIKKGFVFQSKYGKSIMVLTTNGEALKLAQKMGYILVVKKDLKKGFVSIKTIPGKQNDLTPVYEEIIKIDKKENWFLHISKNMLLNGSTKNPYFTPTSLSPEKLIAIIKKI